MTDATDDPGAVTDATDDPGAVTVPIVAVRPDAEGPRSDAAAGPGASPSEPTDDPRVADALSRLAEVDQLPLAEQVEVFGDIHRRLAAVLADPDSRG